MRRHLLAVALVVATAPAPARADAGGDPLLSGYSGPGGSSQAMLGGGVRDGRDPAGQARGTAGTGGTAGGVAGRGPAASGDGPSGPTAVTAGSPTPASVSRSPAPATGPDSVSAPPALGRLPRRIAAALPPGPGGPAVTPVRVAYPARAADGDGAAAAWAQPLGVLLLAGAGLTAAALGLRRLTA